MQGTYLPVVVHPGKERGVLLVGDLALASTAQRMVDILSLVYHESLERREKWAQP